MPDPARSPDPAPTNGLRKHRFLAYGFAISVIAHLLIGPWIHAAPPATAVPDAAQPFTFEKASPPPIVATPEPTPPPATPTPQPLVHAAPAPPAASEVQAPHQTPTYDAPPTQREPGTAAVPSTTTGDAPLPGGSGDGPVVNPGIATEGPTIAATVAPTIAPTATPTPPPTCPNPNAAPSTLVAAPPETPEIAREQGISGTVIVEVRLDAGSHIVGTSVREGPPALRSAALAAARQSTFQTEIRDCKPLGASYLYVVEFQSQ
jgi:outer membrane biosynthesis protein TonB